MCFGKKPHPHAYDPSTNGDIHPYGPRPHGPAQHSRPHGAAKILGMNSPMQGPSYVSPQTRTSVPTGRPDPTVTRDYHNTVNVNYRNPPKPPTEVQQHPDALLHMNPVQKKRVTNVRDDADAPILSRHPTAPARERIPADFGAPLQQQQQQYAGGRQHANTTPKGMAYIPFPGPGTNSTSAPTLPAKAYARKPLPPFPTVKKTAQQQQQLQAAYAPLSAIGRTSHAPHTPAPKSASKYHSGPAAATAARLSRPPQFPVGVPVQAVQAAKQQRRRTPAPVNMGRKATKGGKNARKGSTIQVVKMGKVPTQAEVFAQRQFRGSLWR